MKNILLPTDFSPNAWNAIEYALELFKEEEMHFILLNTYTPALYRVDYAIGGPAYSGIPDLAMEQSSKGLEQTLKRIEERYPNDKHTFRTVSVFNLLIDEICHLCETEDIDLIVMGTQGATGASRVLFGSNTVFAMRKSSVPVLAIPEQYKFRPLENLLFTTDYLSHYKPQDLNPLLSILRLQQAKLTLLHFVEEGEMTSFQEEQQRFLHDYFEGFKHSFKNIYKQYMPDGVYDYIDTHDVDVLVMMNRKHSFVERLLLRQNVDTIGFELRIPFLVLQDHSQS